MNTHHIRITRTVTLRGSVVIEAPLDVTADQVKEFVENTPSLINAVIAADGIPDMGCLPISHDVHAEYTSEPATGKLDFGKPVEAAGIPAAEPEAPPTSVRTTPKKKRK